MVSVFSIPAFFIVLREVLEACLIIGISLAYFSRTGSVQYVRWVWIGAAAGAVVSFGVGVGFAVVFFVRDEQIFANDVERIFEGIMFLVAAALLTWMIVWMLLVGCNLRGRMEDRLGTIVEDDAKSPRQRKLAVFMLLFVHVLREGVETVIFLLGSANANEVGGWRAIPLPATLAIVVGVCTAYMLFKGLVALDILHFFQWSSALLIAFAAGLVSHGFRELQEVGWFGKWPAASATTPRDWYNEAMWTTRQCCPHDSNEFFAMLRALLGYQDSPTFVEWATYFAYWLVVAMVYVGINWRHTRAARMHTHLQATRLSLVALLFSFVGFVYVLMNHSSIGISTMVLAFLLSLVTTFLVFCPLVGHVPRLVPLRRSALIWTAAAWAALTLSMAVLHVVQLVCLGTRGDACGIRPFFFFGLVLRDEYNRLGRTVVSNAAYGAAGVSVFWPAVGTLAVSLVVTVGFFGGLALRVLLVALNVADDGEYMHDEYVDVKFRCGYEAESDSEVADVSSLPDVSPLPDLPI